MGVEVAPSQLNIDPVLVAGDSIERVLSLQEMLDNHLHNLQTRRTSETRDGLEMFH
jgi:hypothetical protein